MVFGSIGNVFGGIGDALAAPFKEVGKFFSKVFCWLKNLHKLILHGIKWLFVKLFVLIFIKPDFMLTGLVYIENAFLYLWRLVVHVLLPYSIILTVFGIVELVVFIITLMGATPDLRAKLRAGFGTLFLCAGDARDWYTVPGFGIHGNRVSWVGALCGRPCGEGYYPAYGGYVCRRLPPGEQHHCPMAAVTRMYEGMRVEGATPDRMADPSKLQCDKTKHIGLDINLHDLRRLAEAVCWQPGAHDNPRLDGYCYSYGCSAGSRRPGFRCSDFSGKTLGDGSHQEKAVSVLIGMALLLLVSAPMGWWITVDANSRMHIYKAASAQFQLM